jgi:hypothetical protein
MTALAAASGRRIAQLWSFWSDEVSLAELSGTEHEQGVPAQRAVDKCDGQRPPPQKKKA